MLAFTAPSGTYLQSARGEEDIKTVARKKSARDAVFQRKQVFMDRAGLILKLFNELVC
jgi:hypothetical protein